MAPEFLYEIMVIKSLEEENTIFLIILFEVRALVFQWRNNTLFIFHFLYSLYNSLLRVSEVDWYSSVLLNP